MTLSHETDSLVSQVDELREQNGALRVAAERYAWLAGLKANSFSLQLNDHASNYLTAKEWIEEYDTEGDFSGVPADLLQAMKDTNTIWRLQIYPETPIGFYMWYGPTLESVIDQARGAMR
jgi:hypothetical protein